MYLSDVEFQDWFKIMISPGNDKDFYCLIFNMNDEPVGEISFHRFDKNTKTAEFNIKIANDVFMLKMTRGRFIELYGVV